ncbi:hypothetical protein PsalMR5_04069 [Piscirickettsia salmonis]|uniref:hypothetical protein n=1 Tax=Piscirickettsia salmonis TaxID=1238 RepID=UPI0012BAE7F8|nr:hypothetical protein [Piscirickettsia salmonis]QGP56578.1 hypothetical protein PsalSR1_04067 [Piscirickettsia salmonis]QGP61386.1 hypothetical protein PsalBI1_04028 [Piscirickettsia salmonis]QGP66144.1 hypothetical protein PsalMR5_04069 [Piscirickettsia salmonis]
MPKYQNQEQQAKKFLEGTYDTLYKLFSQYARRAYEEQRHGPKPKNDRTGDWDGIYNTDSLEKDEEKFINFKKSILQDDKFLNQYSNDKDDDGLLISKQTIDKVKASRRLFIAVARKISLTKKINELNNLLNSPTIKDKLNEQKTTFGKNSNAPRIGSHSSRLSDVPANTRHFTAY